MPCPCLPLPHCEAKQGMLLAASRMGEDWPEQKPSLTITCSRCFRLRRSFRDADTNRMQTAIVLFEHPRITGLWQLAALQAPSPTWKIAHLQMRLALPMCHTAQLRRRAAIQHSGILAVSAPCLQCRGVMANRRHASLLRCSPLFRTEAKDILLLWPAGKTSGTRPSSCSCE